MRRVYRRDEYGQFAEQPGSKVKTVAARPRGGIKELRAGVLALQKAGLLKQPSAERVAGTRSAFKKGRTSNSGLQRYIKPKKT